MIDAEKIIKTLSGSSSPVYIGLSMALREMVGLINAELENIRQASDCLSRRLDAQQKQIGEKFIDEKPANEMPELRAGDLIVLKNESEALHLPSYEKIWSRKP